MGRVPENIAVWTLSFFKVLRLASWAGSDPLRSVLLQKHVRSRVRLTRLEERVPDRRALLATWSNSIRVLAERSTRVPDRLLDVTSSSVKLVHAERSGSAPSRRL